MQGVSCTKLAHEAAPCEDCPLVPFKNRQLFGLEESTLRGRYLRGFDAVDGAVAGRTPVDPDSPAYLYDFAASAGLSGVTLEPAEASIAGTDDNRFLLAIIECLKMRYEEHNN